MKGLLTLGLLVAFLFPALTQNTSPRTDHMALADAYFNADSPSDYTDSLAIYHYTKALEDSNGLSLAMQIQIHKNLGVLRIEKGAYDSAIRTLRNSLVFQTAETDSLFFQINLYLGETYYRTNKLDSASFFLKGAEQLYRKKDSFSEVPRLYNALGVLYFETGNFRQAINYFLLADELIGREMDHSDPAYVFAHHSFMNNIGSSLAKLNKLDSAAAIFQSLIPLNIRNDELHLHLTDIYLEKRQADSAAYFLEKITEDAFKTSLGYLNQQAEIAAMRGDLAGAKKLIKGYLDFRDSIKSSQPDADFRLGKSFQLLGDIAAQEGDWREALSAFHTALQHFNPGFVKADLFENPDEKGLSFATLTMFETFVGKANALANLADESGNEQAWNAAMQTYESIFNRVRYLGSIYDNDEARIFLGESVMPAYQQAVEQLLEKYQSTSDKRFLETAFAYVEDSKSISLTLGSLENTFRTSSLKLQNLLGRQKEANTQIARILSQINRVTDGKELEHLQIELLNQQVLLSRLFEELNKNPDYLEFKLSSSLINQAHLQKNILDNETALVSFYLTANKLHLFILDKAGLTLQTQPLPEHFPELVDRFEKSAYTWQLGDKFVPSEESKRLSNTLFGKDFALRKKRLIIIPHSFLSRIPFDALPLEDGTYLLERFATSIAYSARFLVQNDFEKSDFGKILAMAPFTQADTIGVVTGFEALPFSSKEISGLSKTPIASSQATKDRFLLESPKYPIIHLATHGEIHEADPSQTFIAFYPENENYKLYLDEIMRYNLSGSKLVFLSSCHSHSGGISLTEGIIGLTRAFAYSGISNIITSQWETSDEVAAYLSEAFYRHAKSGREFSEALNLAKLALLQDPKMAQYRHPRFWASFVYVGSPAKIHQTSLTYLFISLLAAGLFAFLYLYNKKRPTPIIGVNPGVIKPPIN
ncbi:CHAT domain-containing protein [Lunatimonas salinarum]|uniref:CHAT domain-containing protein n=1 Tax=Lunatimonas salinarum TaxID=1774590 RepID=UPI001AE027C4|nr:CHAT domain-containing protein [Lunatimonas salinarum]